MEQPIIGITLGDGAGIGPEILLKALSAPEVYNFCRPLVIGNRSLLANTQNNLGLSLELEAVHEKLSQASFQPGKVAVWDFPQLDMSGIKPGQPNKLTGEASVQYIKTAAGLVKGGEIAAITTLPISKQAIYQAGYDYPGHTELLAELTQTNDYAMMLVGGKLRVVLVTTHCAISQVSGKINKPKVLRIIRLVHRCLPCWGVTEPRIAVAALNPHAGEGGLMGKQELEHLQPAVKEARESGIAVWGPLPADSLFYRILEGEFDVAVVMYHDQGLIPLKMLAFRQAVNVTLGLPIVRTSVGHGCAYDIAGKGVADPASLIAALKLASRAVGLKES
jgi:4-hydroxythreonine-4-phosphate dehydrogenase